MLMSVKLRLFFAILTVSSTIALVPRSGSAEDASDQSVSRAGNWCGTQIVWDEKAQHNPNLRQSAACILQGSCDNPATRNLSIPDSTSPIVYIRLMFHVFANSDGSGQTASATDVANAVTFINQDFLPRRIQFEYKMRVVKSTTYRSLSEGEIFGMKNLYAVSPDSQLNIYVPDPEFSYSFGTFPWDSDALGKQGGIVLLHPVHFPPIDNGGTISHEIGHCLGLWHTFHGVDETESCGPCYELANSPDGDLTGDLCEDTPPTPTNQGSCGNPGGTDCGGTAWGATPFRNYMGYAPANCYDNFTPQQAGRIHCWTNTVLSGWIANARVTAAPTFGPLPLVVDFTGSSSKTVSQWTWAFGDGDSSNTQSPQHTYTTAGRQTVLLNIETPQGPYTNTEKGLIWIHADTVDGADVLGTPSQKIKVDIFARNYLPLTSLTIPITWSGPFALPLDSIRTTGLRSSAMDVDTLFTDPPTKRLVLTMTALGTDSLAPGTSPILSLWFRLPPFNVAGVNNISLSTVALWSAQFTAIPGSYSPVVFGGSVSMSCCKVRAGNVDNDPSDITDISDITALIDHLFISLAPLACKAEANCDGDGGGLVDISDLTALIDNLFISLAQLSVCQ